MLNSEEMVKLETLAAEYSDTYVAINKSGQEIVVPIVFQLDQAILTYGRVGFFGFTETRPIDEKRVGSSFDVLANKPYNAAELLDQVREDILDKIRES
jgi:hypothetical protein